MGSTSSGNRSGRRGAPLRRRYMLTGPAAIWVRTLAQHRHNRRDVTPEELDAMLDSILTAYAQGQGYTLSPEPTDE